MAYRTALICKNGHLINGNMQDYPDDNIKYCKDCGEVTICNCSNCKMPIHGDFDFESEFGGYTNLESVPNYCHECGHPYLWTEATIQTIKELFEFEVNLTDEDREILSMNFDDLIKDKPRTHVAALKTKSILSKATEGTKQAFRNITIDIISEVAKKVLFG